MKTKILKMLKAHKQGIRRETVNTFGYIEKEIGSQDVLSTLLNNLKVQTMNGRTWQTVDDLAGHGSLVMT